MTPEQFADKLASLVTQARDAGVSDEELANILNDAVEALEAGAT